MNISSKLMNFQQYTVITQHIKKNSRLSCFTLRKILTPLTHIIEVPQILIFYNSHSKTLMNYYEPSDFANTKDHIFSVEIIDIYL